MWAELTAALVESDIELTRSAVDTFDAALVDAETPDLARTVAHLRAQDPATPVLAIVPRGNVELAVTALRSGASHYVTRPAGLELAFQLRRGVERARAIRDARRTSSPGREVGYIAASEVSQRSLRQIEALAANGFRAALLTGERGTGKEQLAGALHAASRSEVDPLVVVDCAATGPSQLAAALFGRAGGAAGALELAAGGTVYISEVADLDVAGQRRLLGAIRRSVFARDGGGQEQPVDCAIIVGTSALESRSPRMLDPDLVDALSVARVHVAPLRERLEDIAPLVDHFVREFNARLGRAYVGADALALRAMHLYAWPGNVRELRNVVERAMILNRDETEITVGDLPPELVDHAPEALEPPRAARPKSDRTPAPPTVLFELPTDGVDLAALECALLEQALQRAAGNQTRAAALLRISRFALRHRLEKHGLEHLAHGQRGRPRKA